MSGTSVVWTLLDVALAILGGGALLIVLVVAVVGGVFGALVEMGHQVERARGTGDEGSAPPEPRGKVDP